MRNGNPKFKVTTYQIEQELDDVDMITHGCPLRDTNSNRKEKGKIVVTYEEVSCLEHPSSE